MAKIDHVSDTALWVAMFRAIESERPDALFHDPFARELAGERGEEIVRRMPYPELMKWVMSIRTVALDRLIQSAIANGADTIVNLGAGLDTRPFRMRLPATINWIEVDFPELIETKNSRLPVDGAVCQLSRVPLDLSNRDRRREFFASVSANARSIAVLTEGVLMYLENQAVIELAEDLLATPKLEFWIQDYRHGGYSAVMGPKLKVALKDSPFRFKIGNWFSFFEAHGWAVDENIVAWQEAKRVGRRFPYLGFARLSHLFMSRARRHELRDASGFVKLKRKQPTVKSPSGTLQEETDFTIENGLYVFSARYLANRGYCCDSGCRNCPY